jgi:nitroreductase
MNFTDALTGRRSVRRYKDLPVSRDVVAWLIDAAEAAPSAGNLRARKYVVVAKEEMRRALSIAAYNQSQVAEAPVIIVVCADVLRSSSRYGDRGSLYSIQDATAAVMCILLAAHDRGLGTCWVGAFDDDVVREALSLEENVLPVAIISVGYPDESPSPARRRDLGEIVSWVE